MKLFNIYCGLDTKGVLSIEEARGYVERLAIKWFPHGHTILEATGRWEQANAPVTEPTMIVQVLCENYTQEAFAYSLAGDYKTHCFQESVLVTKQEIEADFV